MTTKDIIIKKIALTINEGAASITNNIPFIPLFLSVDGVTWYNARDYITSDQAGMHIAFNTPELLTACTLHGSVLRSNNTPLSADAYTAGFKHAIIMEVQYAG